MKRLHKILCVAVCGFLLPLMPAPAAQADDTALIGGGIGGLALLGVTPTHQLEQIYYLGVLDPQEQVDPMFYRVVVKGQASPISFMKFASGWLPAAVVDSLNEDIGYQQTNGALTLKSTAASTQSANLAQGQAEANGAATKEATATSTETAGLQNAAKFETGRRLVVFGPEGFREAPKNHRLAIIMGSSPENFFKAVDTMLGQVQSVRAEREDAGLRQKLFEAMYLVKTERDGLNEVEGEMRTTLPNP